MATTHDANLHIVVLAWEHCESVSIETWTRFMTHLLAAYPSLNWQDRTLIKDRDKGLAYVADTILPLLNHAHCTQHIKENVQTAYHNISTMFPPLVYALQRLSLSQRWMPSMSRMRLQRSIPRLYLPSDGLVTPSKMLDLDRRPQMLLSRPMFGSVPVELRRSHSCTMLSGTGRQSSINCEHMRPNRCRLG